MRNIITLILIFFIVNSCIDEALFNGGVTRTIEIYLPNYSVIEAESTFEIELVSDTINKVFVTCGENLQEFIDIKVSENILYLKHSIKNNWSRRYEKVKLKLHTKPFSGINVRQPVRIYNNDIYKGQSFSLVDFGKYSELDMNIDVDYCSIGMSSDNFGQFEVKGRAFSALIGGWGSCHVRADSLVTTNCSVLHRGIGNVFVNATGQLDVSLESSGNVFYSGNPSQIIIQHRLGSGNLLKH